MKAGTGTASYDRFRAAPGTRYGRCKRQGKIGPCLYSTFVGFRAASGTRYGRCKRQGKIGPCLYSGRFGSWAVFETSHDDRGDAVAVPEAV